MCFIERMDRGHRLLAAVASSSGVLVVATYTACRYTSPIPLSEGVDCHQLSGVVNLNIVFYELGTEAFEQANLLVIEHNRLFLVVFLEAQQTVVSGVQVVTLLYATQTTRTDVDATWNEH